MGVIPQMKMPSETDGIDFVWESRERHVKWMEKKNKTKLPVFVDIT